MVFSSNLFLFLFLPVVLAGYYLSPRSMRNGWLLAASLLFYGWGGPDLLLLLSLSIGFNYLAGLWIDKVRDTRTAPWALAVTVVANLAPLAYYKYGAFFCDSMASCLKPLGLGFWPSVHVALPIGISFFTFQAMSYVIDVYRRDTPVAKNPVEVALYIVFFPQLIAGPIVRYRDVADQLQSRRETVSLFAEGIERFVLGLAKKVLLANSTASVADQIFDIPTGDLTAAVAWLGIVCYTLQIYFDFSGYSDMAVGLGLMFGVRFVENFNYPYVSRSITEFWRRWHISLSVWFRDYLYIPLGGNRRGAWRTYANLLFVFILCGLWHGASWNFVVWGLFYGVLLVLERGAFGRLLARVPAPLAHAYTVLAFTCGWVLFRAVDLRQALDYYRAMFGFGTGDGLEYHTGLYLDAAMCGVLILAIVGSMPWIPWMKQRLAELRDQWNAESPWNSASEAVFGCVRLTTLAGLLLTSAVLLSASTYNPFIYFRF